MFQRPTAKVNVRQASGGTCILDIEGELTAFAEDALMAAYNQACNAGSHNIVLNFESLEYMSSSGIGLLVTLLIRAQRRQQRLMACGLSDHYQHILELTRLNEAIAMYPTEEQALGMARALAQPVSS